MSNNMFSLWISTVPCPNEDSTEQEKQDFENSFMYLGTSGTYPQNMNYNLSTVGILGQPTDTAMIMDGTGGAVMQIAASAQRINPEEGSMDDPGTFYNEAFIKKLTEMRCEIQMMHNAYILRIYNAQIVSEKDYATSARIKEVRNKLSKPKEMPVYIESFEVSLDLEEPNVVAVDVNFIQRNRKSGYNE